MSRNTDITMFPTCRYPQVVTNDANGRLLVQPEGRALQVTQHRSDEFMEVDAVRQRLSFDEQGEHSRLLRAPSNITIRVRNGESRPVGVSRQLRRRPSGSADRRGLSSGALISGTTKLLMQDPNIQGSPSQVTLAQDGYGPGGFNEYGANRGVMISPQNNASMTLMQAPTAGIRNRVSQAQGEYGQGGRNEMGAEPNSLHLNIATSALQLTGFEQAYPQQNQSQGNHLSGSLAMPMDVNSHTHMNVLDEGANRSVPSTVVASSGNSETLSSAGDGEGCPQWRREEHPVIQSLEPIDIPPKPSGEYGTSSREEQATTAQGSQLRQGSHPQMYGWQQGQQARQESQSVPAIVAELEDLIPLHLARRDNGFTSIPFNTDAVDTLNCLPSPQDGNPEEILTMNDKESGVKINAPAAKAEETVHLMPIAVARQSNLSLDEQIERIIGLGQTQIQGVSANLQALQAPIGQARSEQVFKLSGMMEQPNTYISGAIIGNDVGEGLENFANDGIAGITNSQQPENHQIDAPTSGAMTSVGGYGHNGGTADLASCVMNVPDANLSLTNGNQMPPGASSVHGMTRPSPKTSLKKLARPRNSWTISDYGKLKGLIRKHGCAEKKAIARVFPDRSYEEVLMWMRYYFPATFAKGMEGSGGGRGRK